MSLEERVAQWPVQWLEEGRELGLKQGLEHERALLCRMAGSRFGADTSEHLSAALAGVADQDRLADIGDWLVRCDTRQEFLARVASAANEQEPAPRLRPAKDRATSGCPIARPRASPRSPAPSAGLG